MSRLFAKIFFGFWLTTLIVVGATAVVTTQLNRSIGDGALTEHFRRTQSAYAEAAAAMLDTYGLDGLESWLAELQGPGGPRGVLQILDDQGQGVFDAPSRADVQAAIAERRSGVSSPAALAGVFFDPIYHPDGERYWFVSDLRPGARSRQALGSGFTRHPGVVASRLAVAVIVSGIVCFLLARYLTAPIRRLQVASAEIARGNFNVRTGDDTRRDELGDLARDFDRMSQQLARAQTSQRQLIRDVSHELRSPLARLHLALGLARQRAGDTEQAELERIESEVETLEEIIKQLLDVARLEADAHALPQTHFALDALVHEIVQDANYEGLTEDISIRQEGTTGAQLRGDRAVVRSAVENVVRNALRHTPSGTEITTHLKHDAQAMLARIIIRDHGPGIADDLRDELFKPFVRGDYARDRDSGGYGIGLAIADAAVRRHGGTISTMNHPDGGLEVEISLPTVSIDT